MHGYFYCISKEWSSNFLLHNVIDEIKIEVHTAYIICLICTADGQTALTN